MLGYFIFQLGFLTDLLFFSGYEWLFYPQTIYLNEIYFSCVYFKFFINQEN